MSLVFPDTTALLNFAFIGRIDLLERLVNGQGAWCITVAQECRTSAQMPEFQDAGAYGLVFGDPWYPSAAEHIEIKMLRADLAVPGDPSTRHLGEAETIVIAQHRAAGSRFVTDDREAQRRAIGAGLQPLGTGDLLDLAVRVGFIDARTAQAYERTLRQGRRPVTRAPRT